MTTDSSAPSIAAYPRPTFPAFLEFHTPTSAPRGIAGLLLSLSGSLPAAEALPPGSPAQPVLGRRDHGQLPLFVSRR